MKGNSMLRLVLGALAVLAARAEHEEICARLKEGAKFREPGNCQGYVTCKNGIGKLALCPSGELFDKSKCLNASKVTDCDAPCSNPADEGRWLTDPLSCNGFYFCRNGEALYGSCYDGYNFNEQYQVCDFATDTPCYGFPMCTLVATGVTYSDPERCNTYFSCKDNAQEAKTCGADKYFDVEKGCVSKFNVDCERHPPPAGICSKLSKPIVNEPVSDTVTCRGYFYCAFKGTNLPDPNPTWYQCPEGTFFDSTAKSCREAALVKCKYDRCDGRENLMVLAENEYCQHYHVCRDGKSSGLQRCTRDMFFKESVQACVYEEITSPICDS